MAAEFHPVPPEMLEAVLTFADNTTLATLTRCSHIFRLVAERILYSSCNLADPLKPSDSTPWKTSRCCETILSRPHLAAHVRFFQVQWRLGGGSRDSFNAKALMPSQEHLELLRTVLGRLFALEALELSLVGQCDILPQAHHPQLRSVVLASVAPLDAFLSGHPSIEHLQLSPLPAFCLDYTALPFLTSFRGTPSAAAALVPGRPVRRLTLWGHEPDPEHLDAFSRSLSPITTFDISNLAINPSLLRVTSSYLPSIEDLRVRLALRHTLHFAMSGIRLLAGLTQVLERFPALRVLDLSATAVDGVGQDTHNEEHVLCIAWSKHCPSLQVIRFPSSECWSIGPEGTWALSSFII